MRAAPRKRGFTLVELLVVLAVIALLTAIVFPVSLRVRDQARAMRCASNLRQWSLVFSMYTTQSNGKLFATGPRGAIASSAWIEQLGPFYGNDRRLLRCPSAARRDTSRPAPQLGARSDDLFSAIPVPELGAKRLAWEIQLDENREPVRGSYGLSSWVSDITIHHKVDQNNKVVKTFVNRYWRTVPMRGVANIPVLLDCVAPCSLPRSFHPPPDFDDTLKYPEDMSFYCIDRHGAGRVNTLFMDWSVSRVGLKQLWTLKWNRSFETDGEWTRRGGVTLEDWPKWMRKFQDN